MTAAPVRTHGEFRTGLFWEDENVGLNKNIEALENARERLVERMKDERTGEQLELLSRALVNVVAQLQSLPKPEPEEDPGPNAEPKEPKDDG